MMVRVCPKCGERLSARKLEADEWARDEYYVIDLTACDQWYVETYVDHFCGPDTVTLTPIESDIAPI
jgi:hypothetical protein